ncbi:dUTP diphosphatase [Fusobacterium phage JD-Fnp2]|nr:dUTP diphosphatase [Fusobacterium phage JD-Fnp2]UTV61061.1 dUTP diphosphatase [Fusobacterium phage JD-Fnp3]UTV61143.1 dUTP diphosphatase [Fusobacterium phage JD-Fnp5]
MEFKRPETFEDILNLQKHLDENLNNVRKRTLGDIKKSIIAECIEFDEETPQSHKTWKTKPYDKDKELEELTDIWFFVAQMVNHCEAIEEITKFEKIELFKFFNNENNPYMEEINVLTIIFDLRSPTMSYEYLKWVIIDLSNLTNQYGYTTDDILKTYWEKWQKNMKRIGKEWN